MGGRTIMTAILATLVVACSELPAIPAPSPSGGGGFIPALGATAPPSTARATATATATAAVSASASPSPSASASSSPSPSPSPTALAAADIVAKVMASVGAQTAWSDRTIIGGLVKVVATDGSVTYKAPSTVATTTVSAPDKRELVVVDNVTGATTLHTILIGSDLFTEVAGVGWEQAADRAFAVGPAFAVDAILGAGVAAALRAGPVTRESDAQCDEGLCYVLTVDYAEGTGAAAAKARTTIQVDQKLFLPTRMSSKFTYADGLFYLADRSLRDWSVPAKIAAPTVVAAAPAPSVTPSPAPTAAPTVAPTVAPPPPPTAAPTPTPVPIDPPNAPTGYSRFAVGTARGTYTVFLVKERLADVTVRTVTANAVDCASNCPAKPLAQYVAETGAIAGMNGSYFCPPDYADCANQAYKYDYAVYNSSLGKWLSLGNGANGVATWNGKTPAFYATFNQYGRLPVTAGISNYPTLMLNGTILNFASQLSDAQNRAGTRGAVGVNGTYVFLAIIAGASVTDAAFVMQALGARDALNLDGGGSAALYSGGAYRVGPGRLLPNAIVLTRP